MSNLPEEIIVEILSRLPVKSLLRFRCVSNPWRNLISSPNFAKLHLKQTSEHNADIDHHTVLILWSLQIMKTMNYDPSETYHFNDLKLECPEAASVELDYIRIWGSCNGLIFLRVNFEDIAIWNPSTRDCKVLPKPGVSPNQFTFFGFGFDASIDDYKVVVGYHYSDDSPVKVKVYSLKTNTWRRVQYVCNLQVVSMAGTLANGILHWLKEDGTIMSFDLAQEQFGKFVSLSIPCTFASQNIIDVEFMKLGVLQGCLCLVIPEVVIPEVDSKNDEVWVMKEYGVNSSWSKLFSVFPHFVYINPLCILKSGVVLLDVDGRQLQTYSPKDNTFKPICDSWVWLEAVVYVESLVSLS